MDPEPSPPASFSSLRTDTPQTFVLSEPSAEIYSDFNHTGQIEYVEERALLGRRAGSILLPFFKSTLVHDETRLYDEYLTPVHIRPAAPHSVQPGDTLELEYVHGGDQPRVALYRQADDAPGGWNHVLGIYAVGTSGDAVGPDEEHVPIEVPADWTGEDFLMCATTLAGDPYTLGPLEENPPPPAPAGFSHETLRPGEVWMRLRSAPTDAPSPKRRRTAPPAEAPSTDDLALFQIAPFLLQSNLEPAHRLYAVSKPENHNCVYDLIEACWKAFGAPGAFDRDFGRPIPASTPDSLGEDPTVQSGNCLLSPDTMYLIDGTQYRDFWAQDQMAIGYCSAPGEDRAFNVALHCKRENGLGKFVSNEMEDPSDEAPLFVFDSLLKSEGEGKMTDYGGNIAVTPPVPTETDPENTPEAGPPVPAHPAAPHGKLVLGDCANPAREDSAEQGTGVVHDQTRTFLQSQIVQPIIPIDTSWLDVGHVDEIMTFVPAPNAPSDRPAKLVMPGLALMDTLLDRTTAVDVAEGRTHFHRGRHTGHNRLLKTIIEKDNEDTRSLFAASYAETSVEMFCEPDTKTLNDTIRNRFLDPIEDRLCQCTGLSKSEDVLRLPMYFELADATQLGNPWGEALAKARMPNLVNMQVLTTGPEETHLLMPRPCGPRLPTDKAETVVRSVLNDTGQEGTEVCLPKESQDHQPGFPFWAWPTLDADTLALFFTHRKPSGQCVNEAERKQMIDVIKQNESPDALADAPLRQAVRDTRDTILAANGGPDRPIVGPDGNKATLLNDKGKFTNWHRLFIPEDTVDIVEAYTASVLKEVGCTVHFVDAWFYHCGGGDVHCATNVLHTPPTAQSLSEAGRRPWWEHYPALAADDVNTAYDPADTVYHSSDPAS